ncbi:DUF3562 domain-containing protein [Caballeronia sp. dw_19]|uniref:DUF3562 domain-containing protein n=1 Tax=Caballeronia sp. dw_19 TaxID=2719791 RepID=UPI001BD6554B
MPCADVGFIHSIAIKTQTPQGTVSRMYGTTLAEIGEGAKVLDYIALLAAKRVRRERFCRDKVILMSRAEMTRTAHLTIE